MKRLLLILLLSVGAVSLLAGYCSQICPNSDEGYAACIQDCGSCDTKCAHFNMTYQHDEYESCMNDCMND